jgi:pyruvate/2-oxoglutarate dehydrogenase complex dihydrolipoamide acyltransferase (E2) component
MDTFSGSNSPHAAVIEEKELTSQSKPTIIVDTENPQASNTLGTAVEGEMREVPYPRFRNVLVDFVALSAKKHSFYVLMSYDASAYIDFAQRCKKLRKRPPSIVAYMARCLGVVLAKNPDMMAAQLGQKILIPSDVNLIVAMEVKTAEGDMLPILVKTGAANQQSLTELGDKLTELARFYKRNPINSGRIYRAAHRFAGFPMWLRRFTYLWVSYLPGAKRRLSHLYTHVALTSTTQFIRGHRGWGLPVYPFTMCVAMGGLSKQAVVVGEEILARDCLDVTFTFDHAVLDGARATRFVADFADEFQSGRLLAEFPLEEKL